MPNKISDKNALRQAIKDCFPLFAQEEYETKLNNGHYPIGINTDYPAELRERLTAASISYVSNNKSMDYFRKKYMSNIPYEDDPGGEKRQDRRIREICLVTTQSIIDGLVAFRDSMPADSKVGEYISDSTLIRIPYSLKRSFAEADKGALFEALVILRMALEQMCWAIKIRTHDNPEIIKTTSATKSITHFSKQYPKLGRLNGWLSSHAHWAYDGHIKVMFERPGYTMKASYMFKGCAYVALIVYTDLFRQILSKELKEFINWDVVSETLDVHQGAKNFDFKKEFDDLRVLFENFYPDISKLGS